jgi:hypothetical protein
VTRTEQTTRTLEEGSRLTAKRTSYNYGPDVIRTTDRLPDGTQKTVSTSKNSTSEDTRHFLAVLVVLAGLVLFFGWPWFLHITMGARIAIARGWYVLLVVAAIVGAQRGTRNKAG